MVSISSFMHEAFSPGAHFGLSLCAGKMKNLVTLLWHVRLILISISPVKRNEKTEIRSLLWSYTLCLPPPSRQLLQLCWVVGENGDTHFKQFFSPSSKGKINRLVKPQNIYWDSSKCVALGWVLRERGGRQKSLGHFLSSRFRMSQIGKDLLFPLSLSEFGQVPQHQLLCLQKGDGVVTFLRGLSWGAMGCCPEWTAHWARHTFRHIELYKIIFIISSVSSLP